MKRSQFISMDLGTANTLVYIEGQGVVYDEPAIVAYNTREQRIVAVGNEAFDMIGKGNRILKIIKPMAHGVISDIKAVLGQLNHIFLKLQIDRQFQGCIMLLACPSQVTALEKKALEKIGLSFGARRVFIEEEVKMSALGGGLNIDAPRGCLVVDMGGGTTDVAVLSSGDIVLSDSIKVAGNVINEDIIKYIKSKHQLDIGFKTAEVVKISIGSVNRYADENSIKIFGRDATTGLPREVAIYPEELRDIIKFSLAKIINLIVSVLEQTPPELSGDIFTSGILLTGGSALIKGIERFFKETLNLPVKVCPQPLLAVINGTRKYEENIYNLMKREEELKNLKKDDDFKLI